MLYMESQYDCIQNDISHMATLYTLQKKYAIWIWYAGHRLIVFRSMANCNAAMQYKQHLRFQLMFVQNDKVWNPYKTFWKWNNSVSRWNYNLSISDCQIQKHDKYYIFFFPNHPSIHHRTLPMSLPMPRRRPWGQQKLRKKSGRCWQNQEGWPGRRETPRGRRISRRRS